MNTPEQRAAYTFFKKHAGYVVGHRAEGAKDLADAEAYASAQGWYTTWERDDGCDPEDYENANEVEVAVLRTMDGEIIGALGCITDADQNYRRVIEAELALEALAEVPGYRGQRRRKALPGARTNDRALRRRGLR